MPNPMVLGMSKGRDSKFQFSFFQKKESCKEGQGLGRGP